MSTLSDVQALYGSVRDTWTKSQAHILTHVVAGIVVFAICRVTLPELPIPKVDPKQITENEWFKLAKDTGLVYVSLVLPVIAVAIYNAVLRAAGQMLIAIITMVFPPSIRQNRIDLLSVGALEPLALTLQTTDFDLGDLQQKANQLAMKYQSKKSEAWDSIQKGMSELTKDSFVYLGDFSAFILGWIILFKMTPEAAWTQTNQSRFWPVILIFISLAWFAWFRVSRAMSALPNLYLMYVSAMLHLDPDMAPFLEASDEKREKVRQRLEEVLQEAKERQDRHPSLRRFLMHRLGLSTSKPAKHRREQDSLFRDLYERGRRFSWQAERQEKYDQQWLGNYLAYVYHRLYDWLSGLVRTIWQLIRYLVTGTP